MADIYTPNPKPVPWVSIPAREYGRLACCGDELDEDGAIINYPLTFANMVGWLRADRTGFTAADGAGVGQPATIWVDQSGDGTDAVQAGIQPIPTYETNEVNGKPVIRFDALSETLEFPELVFTGDFTVILVGRTDVGADTLWLNHGTSNHQLRKNQSGHDAASYAGVGFHSSTAFDGLSSTFQMTTWRRSGTTFSWRQNKTARGTASEAVQTLSLNRLCNNSFLGSGRGDIGELAFYGAHRSDVEMDALYDNWFQKKWLLP